MSVNQKGWGLYWTLKFLKSQRILGFHTLRIQFGQHIKQKLYHIKKGKCMGHFREHDGFCPFLPRLFLSPWELELACPACLMLSKLFMRIGAQRTDFNGVFVLISFLFSLRITSAADEWTNISLSLWFVKILAERMSAMCEWVGCKKLLEVDKLDVKIMRRNHSCWSNLSTLFLDKTRTKTKFFKFSHILKGNFLIYRTTNTADVSKNSTPCTTDAHHHPVRTGETPIKLYRIMHEEVLNKNHRRQQNRQSESDTSALKWLGFLFTMLFLPCPVCGVGELCRVMMGEKLSVVSLISSFHAFLLYSIT